MRSRLLLPFVISVTIIFCQVSECRTLARKERSIAELAKMVKVTTGRKAIDFVPYGNWCGIGGSGKPLDLIDKCCQTHDYCYEKAHEQGKCKAVLSLYFAKYNWKLEKGDIVCSLPEDGNECDLASCYCDREVALCLGKNIDSYQKDHKFGKSFGR